MCIYIYYTYTYIYIVAPEQKNKQSDLPLFHKDFTFLFLLGDYTWCIKGVCVSTQSKATMVN
jgi:hypothetical protein